MNINFRQQGFNISPATALCLLLCIFIICFIVASVLNIFIVKALPEDKSVAAVRIAAMLQDVIVFIVPAVATAVVANRRPAGLLAVMKWPNLGITLMAIVAMVAAIPAMDWLVNWNGHLDFSFLGEKFNEMAQAMEAASAATLHTMMGGDSLMDLVVNILIIGIAAGVSEELLFRGCLVRLLLASRVNRHAAVWGVAILFSLMHMQFYGFVPRMLLGAFFGYLLIWSGTVWLPVIIHVLNNSIYVFMAWMQVRQGKEIESETLTWSPILCVVSLVLTVLALVLLYRACRQSQQIME